MPPRLLRGECSESLNTRFPLVWRPHDTGGCGDPVPRVGHGGTWGTRGDLAAVCRLSGGCGATHACHLIPSSTGRPGWLAPPDARGRYWRRVCRLANDRYYPPL